MTTCNVMHLLAKLSIVRQQVQCSRTCNSLHVVGYVFSNIIVQGDKTKKELYHDSEKFFKYLLFIMTKHHNAVQMANLRTSKLLTNYYLGVKFLIIYHWRLRMLLVKKKKPWKNFYTLIHFTQWKSVLVNCELSTVSQDFIIVVCWFKPLALELDI